MQGHLVKERKEEHKFVPSNANAHKRCNNIYQLMIQDVITIKNQVRIFF